MTCRHENFVVNVEVNRLVPRLADGEPDLAADMEALTVDVTAKCVDCGEPIVFRGLKIGMLSIGSSMLVDGTELRIPARMQSHDPHFGLGVPGFIARVAEADHSTRN